MLLSPLHMTPRILLFYDMNNTNLMHSNICIYTLWITGTV